MAALTSKQLQFYSSRRLSGRVWMEGDSYAAGASGAGLCFSLRALGFTVIVAAVGGSTMTDIRDRLIADAGMARHCKIVVWDGSQNGYTTDSAYADLLEAGLQAAEGLGLVVIPAAAPYGTADTTQVVAIRDEFTARWGARCHDWREAIANTAGVIDQNRMLNYPTDTVHLNTTAHGEEAAAIAALL
jgi:hypothetical protein